MDIEHIHRWLRKPSSVSVLPAGTTRGQALAAIIFGQWCDDDPWRADTSWRAEMASDLAELDDRLVADPQAVSSTLRAILSCMLCGGLSCPTR